MYSTSPKVIPLSPRRCQHAFLITTSTRDISTMPRAILAPICSNSRPRRELSDGKKNRLIGRWLAGQKPATIAREESVNKSTVYKLIQRYKERQNTDNAPRSGRPHKYLERDIRVVTRLIRNNPKITFKAIRKQTGLNISNSTLKRLFHDEGLKHWRARGRPELSERYATIRLRWALNHRHTDWSKWVFSDECSVETSKGQKPQWV
jgi:transposase